MGDYQQGELGASALLDIALLYRLRKFGQHKCRSLADKTRI
jgi:hypothetical protein